MPSVSDRFESDACAIITNPSKGYLHLYGTDPNEIKIEDIANALGNQCRFTGHMRPGSWYSVLEHECDVSTIIRLAGGSAMDQYCGLMHDSTEFGLSDIAAPFKREVEGYYEKEHMLWKRIAAKFGLPEILPDIVKWADWTALFIEADQFVCPGDRERLKSFGNSEYLQPALDMHYSMVGYPPGGAIHQFMFKFKTLRIELGLV